MNILKSKKAVTEFWFSSEERSNEETAETVRKIITDVRTRKDAALKKYTLKYDGAQVTSFKMSAEEIEQAQESLESELRDIFLQAADNIRTFHERQKPNSWLDSDKDGITLGLQYSPVESAGVYVPGGRAVYPSTVLMNCIPAQVAGVTRIAIATPPDRDGKISQYILGCAGLLGITEVYRLGGAQAIAALAYGTESVKPVVKITGPGNKYVNEAKKQVFGKVGIDLPAGPTEIVILADDSVPIQYVVWDIAAQAEHDPDAKTLVITTSKTLFNDFQKELAAAVERSPRKDIIIRSIEKNGGLFLVDSVPEGVVLINSLAPEHTELMVEGAEKLSKEILNSGAVFLGSHTPGAVGDYWAGPNHTLPTAGAARFASPLTVLDFMKCTSITGYSKEALAKISKAVSAFARTEQLYAHAQSVEVRNGKLA
jgi:histidinol dehydrogenase